VRTGNSSAWGFIAAGLLATLVLGACSDGGGEDAGLEVGEEAPGFSLPAAGGSIVSLADYDEPVLLYFHMADG
jgi:hypothetical protein